MQIKKILFISPPFNIVCGDIIIYLPFQLCLLASITRNAGYETYIYNMDVPPMESKVVDDYIAKAHLSDRRDLIERSLWADPMGIWQELEDVLNEIKPDVVGISVLTSYVPTALKTAEICKMYNPNIVTIMGGIHATLRPQDFIANEDIDFVFSGEAEGGILRFFSALKKKNNFKELRKIAGLTFKTDTEIHYTDNKPIIEVNSYPIMSRDLFVFPERYQPKNMGCMFIGRGCCFKCKFCASTKLSGYRIRSRTNESIICEVEHLIKTYGINEIMFMEDTLTVNRKKIIDLCRLLKERGLKLNWRCTTRADCIDEELLEEMMSAGLGLINIGIETGSEEMMKYIGKGITLDKIVKTLELFRRIGLKFSPYFMIGYPEEKPHHAEETIAFIRDKVRNHFTYNICIPNPGTEFFDDCIRLGMINKDEIDWTRFNAHSRQTNFTKYLDKEQMNHYLTELDKLASVFNATKTPGTFSPHERDSVNRIRKW